MAEEVIIDTEIVTCPHCSKRVVLTLSTNCYRLGEYGKPSISVDEVESRQDPLKVSFLGRMPKKRTHRTSGGKG